uniref:Uncharacterized protein n=1 Tax=Arion vulgaris TaxID=1028688 RepID=A0A0B7A7U3_9EUPU
MPSLKEKKKIKLLNKKERGWNETSKILAGSSAVKLVAEEILLEVTAKVTRDVASEDIHQDVMFKRMSANMFMNETEVISTGNLKGRDLSDPVYDMVTHLFSSLHRNRDNRKRGIWVHSQPIVHPALPPPLPLIREPLSDSQKLPRRKASQKPDKKLDQTSRTKVV